MIFKNLEEKFGITIPSDFKLFQKLIELNNPLAEYFDPKENFSFRCTKWLAFVDKKVRIDMFFHSSSLEDHWRRQLVMWGSLDYLPFGSLVMPYSGQLLYSNLQGDLGKIYYTETGTRKPIYLASDLFVFVESLKIEYSNDQQKMFSSLYKNWGEGFWRIREDLQ